jgi:hypothetical protein
MQRVGQWIVFAALSVLLLLWAIALGLSFMRGAPLLPGAGMIDLFALFLFFAVPGALLWIAGWIVEGFAKRN